jgi:hypothetical protein
MTRHAPLALALAALVAAGHLVALCEGGGYGRGKPHRLGMYPKDQWYLNHSPAPAANSPMPREFNWGDENGTNYLTTSWNQHIPRQAHAACGVRAVACAGGAARRLVCLTRCCARCEPTPTVRATQVLRQLLGARHAVHGAGQAEDQEAARW